MKRPWPVVPWWLPTAAALLGCGGEETSDGGGTSTGGGPSDCLVGERAVGTECRPAGVQDDGCEAGTHLTENGTCQAAGIPAEDCAEGFEPTGDGACMAILPTQPCGAGTMALPGETTCHPPSECGEGTWGDLPVDGATVYVDGSYSGPPSDGSVDRPYTTLAEAFAAAPAGAMVAIAAGTYAGGLTMQGKAVELRGRCAELVIVELTNTPVLTLREGASGAVVSGMQLVGGNVGVLVSGAEQVTLEGLWIRDAGRGVNLEPTLGPASATIRATLVEGALAIGVFVSGATAVLDGVVLRDGGSGSDPVGATGLSAQRDPDGLGPSDVQVVGSVIEGSRTVSALVLGSTFRLERSVIRDTQPDTANRLGRGLSVQWAGEGELGSNATVIDSVVERSHEYGIFVAGSELDMARSVVRDTEAQVDDLQLGSGLHVEADQGGLVPSAVTVRSSVLEGNRTYGLFVAGAELEATGLLVRGTRPNAADGHSGRGINVQPFVLTGQASKVTLRGCTLEDNHETSLLVMGATLEGSGLLVRRTLPWPDGGLFGRGLGVQSWEDTLGVASLVGTRIADNHEFGIFVNGSMVTLRGVAIADTRPRVADGRYGRGLNVQGQGAVAEMLGGTVADSHEFGIIAISAELSVEDTRVSDTVALTVDGGFGDGVTGFSLDGPASVALRNSLVERSARAGVSSFGATMGIADDRVECNKLDLVAEPFQGTPAAFTNNGGNWCGCGDDARTCKAVGAGLEPPSVVDAPPP